MNGGCRFRGAVAALALSFGSSRSEVPPLYGAAVLREDTAVAAFTAVCADSTRAVGGGWPLSSTLHLLSLPIARAKVSLRTGVGGSRPGRLSLYMQEAAVTIPLSQTTLQAGFGYQPVRVRETRHTLPVITPEKIYPEEYRLDWYNIDRFRVAANGMTGIDGLRYLVYGAELVMESLSGTKYYQSTAGESSYDYVEYRQYGQGDGSVAALTGFGYWREVIHRGQPYKFLWLLEGSFSRNRQAVRFNDGIVPLLLSYESNNDRYQYNVRATGFSRREGGAQLRFLLSRRCSTVLPEVSPGSSSGLLVSVSTEKVSCNLGMNVIENDAFIYDKSNVFPDGSSFSGTHFSMWGPAVGSDHSFRAYITHAAVKNYLALFGNLLYRSSGTGYMRGGTKMAFWKGGGELWLGICSLWYHRVAAEFLWKGYAAGAEADCFAATGKRRTDVHLTNDPAPGNVFAVNVRMLR